MEVVRATKKDNTMRSSEVPATGGNEVLSDPQRAHLQYAAQGVARPRLEQEKGDQVGTLQPHRQVHRVDDIGVGLSLPNSAVRIAGFNEAGRSSHSRTQLFIPPRLAGQDLREQSALYAAQQREMRRRNGREGPMARAASGTSHRNRDAGETASSGQTHSVPPPPPAPRPPGAYQPPAPKQPPTAPMPFSLSSSSQRTMVPLPAPPPPGGSIPLRPDSGSSATRNMRTGSHSAATPSPPLPTPVPVPAPASIPIPFTATPPTRAVPAAPSFGASSGGASIFDMLQTPSPFLFGGPFHGLTPNSNSSASTSSTFGASPTPAPVFRNIDSSTPPLPSAATRSRDTSASSSRSSSFSGMAEELATQPRLGRALAEAADRGPGVREGQFGGFEDQLPPPGPRPSRRGNRQRIGGVRHTAPYQSRHARSDGEGGLMMPPESPNLPEPRLPPRHTLWAPPTGLDSESGWGAVHADMGWRAPDVGEYARWEPDSASSARDGGWGPAPSMEMEWVRRGARAAAGRAAAGSSTTTTTSAGDPSPSQSSSGTAMAAAALAAGAAGRAAFQEAYRRHRSGSTVPPPPSLTSTTRPAQDRGSASFLQADMGWGPMGLEDMHSLPGIVLEGSDPDTEPEAPVPAALDGVSGLVAMLHEARQRRRDDLLAALLGGPEDFLAQAEEMQMALAISMSLQQDDATPRPNANPNPHPNPSPLERYRQRQVQRRQSEGMSYEQLVQLEDVRVTVPKHVVDGLRTCPVSKTATDSCAICQVEYAVGEQQMHLPCKHCFHADCVRPWLLDYSKKCPVCKTEVC